MKTSDSWHQFQEYSKPLIRQDKVPGHHKNKDSVTGEVTKSPLPQEPFQSGKIGKTLDAATLQRFRRGQMGIDGHIDLHGLNQGEAHDQLHGFLGESLAKGYRCLLVITGKGRDDQGKSQGVLKKFLPRWLEISPYANDILSFTPAQTKDGGSGAFYILLRRRRYPAS